MIYLVEDDESIRELVVYTLNNLGMKASGFELPSQFWRALEHEPAELILLDIMLPEEDGLHILKRLRSASATRDVPVIMLTAKGTEYDKVVGLDSGADDYIPKPFGMMELVARIRAILRRTSSGEKAVEYHIGALRVSPAAHTVSCGGENVTLTLKEFELLSLMAENMDVVFTRAQLLDKIWGYGFDGETRTVDVHIRTLRQKLGDCGALIQTVRGVGYKLSDNTGGDAS